MKVSIITPSYNHAEFIEATIRSVLAQDYPDIEYIIIDGGSRDGTLDIIRRYEGRIARWVSEPDGGQSCAINKGFRIATGEIVAWLNSDDIYFPYAVSTAVQRFKRNPNLTVFYGDAVFINRQGQFIRYFTEVEPFNRNRLCSCSDYIMQPTTFFRRDRLLQVGLLDESLRYAMDWDLWCRFARRGCEFHYEQEIIAANREYGGTKTLSGAWDRIREIGRVVQRNKTSILPHAFWNYLRQELLTQHRSPLAAFLIKSAFYPLTLPNLHWHRTHLRHLYGLFAHTGLVQRECRIRTPLFAPPTKLIVSVQCPWEQPHQEMTVRVDEEPILHHLFRGDATPQSFGIPLPEDTRRRGYVDVRFNFGQAYTKRGIAAVLHHLSVV